MDQWESAAAVTPERTRRGWVTADGQRTGPDPLWGAEEVSAEQRWWVWFLRARLAVWRLYRVHGLGPLVGSLPGRSMSGCEQTVMVAGLLSQGDPAAVDGASAGVAAALEEIEGGS